MANVTVASCVFLLAPVWVYPVPTNLTVMESRPVKPAFGWKRIAPEPTVDALPLRGACTMRTEVMFALPCMISGIRQGVPALVASVPGTGAG